MRENIYKLLTLIRIKNNQVVYLLPTNRGTKVFGDFGEATEHILLIS